MSSNLKQQLQAVLQHSIDNHQFERAEQAVTHLRELSEIEAFIMKGNEDSSHKMWHQESDHQEAVSESTASTIPETAKPAEDKEREGVMLYYIKEENVIKFKKPPQTYAVQIEFLEQFLKNLEEWKNKSSFSSKDYYDHFSSTLQEYTTYQSSTLRQFITLLFRISHHLGVLEKTTPPQRSRYVVPENMDTEKVMEEITNNKVIEL